MFDFQEVLKWTIDSVFAVPIWLWVFGTAAVLMFVLGSKRVLRWPIVVVIAIILALQLIAYALVRCCVKILELLLLPHPSNRASRQIRKKMWEAENYRTWKINAKQLDSIENREEWKRKRENR